MHTFINWRTALKLNRDYVYLTYLQSNFFYILYNEFLI